MAANERCEACVFFLDPPEIDPDRHATNIRGLKPEDAILGTCRRFPPAVAHEGARAAWSTVLNSQWCGEFKERRDDHA